jgi:hypothetical protein
MFEQKRLKEPTQKSIRNYVFIQFLALFGKFGLYTADEEFFEGHGVRLG